MIRSPKTGAPLMASAEHEFVSSTFLSVADYLARSELFTFAEADRRRFDFACLLTQHKERLVVGETLHHHAAGIEKDLNSLLLDDGDSVPVYLSHTASHVSRIGEVVENFRHSVKGYS
jgi:hypothetical protein